MLSGMFIVDGIDAVRHPASKVAKAETVTPALLSPLGLSTDTEKLVRMNGAVQVGAGTLLALGKLPRLAALVLATSLVPTTLAGHRFWEETDTGARQQQRIHFLKNLGLLGGLLSVAIDTGGRPSITWTTRRAAKHAAKVTRHAARATREPVERALHI